MTKMMFGVFSKRIDAEMAIDNLQAAGYKSKDLSIIMQDRSVAQEIGFRTGAQVGDGAISGAATGGVLGGIAGLLIGMGGIAIPGVGALLVGGPIAAALGLGGAAATTVSGAVTGALAGGLVGALVNLGLPEEEALIYERHIREGAILVMVPIIKTESEEIRQILEDNGATQVKYLTD